MPRNPARDPRSSALTVIAVVAVLAAAVLAALATPGHAAGAAGTSAGSGSMSSSSAVGQQGTAAAKRRRRARRRRTCVVKRVVAGRLRTVFHRVYAYRTIRVGGRRVRIIVRKRVAFRGPCARRCARVRRGKIVFRRKRMRVLVPRRIGNRVVLVRRRKRVKVPRLRACPSGRRRETVLGTPITITLRDTSYGVLDFGAFQREAPLTGAVRGYTLGRFTLNSLSNDVDFTLTGGRIGIGSTAVFIDDECNGEVSAAIRTGSPAFAALDTTRQSTATYKADTARIQSIVRLRLRVPVELRNDDTGCHSPYITTGYTETRLSIGLSGTINFAGGALGLDLQSGQQFLSDFTACISPGDPTQPCSQFAIPFPFLLQTFVDAELAIGKYGRITVP
jgi:hypothetical protein